MDWKAWKNGGLSATSARRARALLLATVSFACGNGSSAGGAARDAGTVTDAGPAADATPGAEDAAVSTHCGAPDAQIVDPTSAAPLNVVGDVGSTLGIFDPSVLYAPDAGAGVMSYSSVPSQGSIFTRIALSTDLGATWTYATDVNAATAVTVATNDATACGAATCAGRLVHEVSSIAFDPTDVPLRQYKLLVHSYVVLSSGALRYDWGHIGMQTAGSASGPWSAESAVVGWTSSAPALSEPAGAWVATDTPDLADCFLFTEPGAIVRSGVLDLALGCVALGAADGGGNTTRIVLVRSTDHGATWSYVTTMLAPADATCVGATTPQINAADLFAVGATEYLIASPVPANGAYDGCLTFAVADPVAGTIARDGAGHPTVLRGLAAPGGAFMGACAYAAGATAAGYLAPQAFLGQPSGVFRIFRSGIAGP